VKRFVRFSRNLILILLLAVAVGGGIVLATSRDPFYTLQEWVGWARFHRYDALINRVAVKNNIDPMLLKAVIWRESAFDPEKQGREGERGLMQVSEGAASDWAAAQKTDRLDPDKLFDPETNIEVGAWYLKRALAAYNGKDDPFPFALAEYNAGRQRVNQWVGTDPAAPLTADQFRKNISISSTRKYVDTIEDRYQFYKARGRM
jgi:soluble lytic murein transglycosylase